MTQSVVSISNLGHSYRPAKWVFRNHTASIAKGEVVAILGPNGRGKTTLLKILLGALKPTEGDTHIEGPAAFVP